MAPKRKKSHVDGKVESQDGSAANLGDMSTFDFAKPVYLVAEHEEHEGEKTAYSIFKVNASATTGGTKSLRVHTIAGLPNTTSGMSFVTAHSKLGSWIVGVGGKSRAGTIILDPSTLETYQGRGSCTPEATPSSSPSPTSLFVACPVSKNNGVTTASALLFHISIMATCPSVTSLIIDQEFLLPSVVSPIAGPTEPIRCGTHNIF
ncbi:hypothetical protein HU200_032440 [Digitaria exilis]|uniref:Uncharacterized protein n=1 Tax=Digitaria exilis TaxID=1010633 RepID=A0A835BYZ0_9POAL|nr:hypothetical protein HU200_032440 [Digitaria exilis]